MAEAYATVKKDGARYEVAVAVRRGSLEPVFRNDAVVDDEGHEALERVARELVASVLEGMRLASLGKLGPPREEIHRRGRGRPKGLAR